MCQALKRLESPPSYRPPSRRPLRSTTTSAPLSSCAKMQPKKFVPLQKKVAHSSSNDRRRLWSSTNECRKKKKSSSSIQQQPSQQMQQQGGSNGVGYTITRQQPTTTTATTVLHWTTYGQSTHHHYHLNLIQHTFHPFIPRVKTMLPLLNWFILVKAVIELLFPDGSKWWWECT